MCRFRENRLIQFLRIKPQTLAIFFSLSLIASSTAISQKLFIECLTFFLTTPVPSGFTRILTAQSMTRLTPTKTFISLFQSKKGIKLRFSSFYESQQNWANFAIFRDTLTFEGVNYEVLVSYTKASFKLASLVSRTGSVRTYSISS